MVDEVRTTMSTPSSPGAHAREDTGDRHLVAVPSSAIRAASGPTLHQLAARSRLPTTLLERLAERGEAVVVAEAPHDRQAEEARRRVDPDGSLRARVVPPHTLGLWGMALTGLAAALMLTLLTVLVAWWVDGLWWAAPPGVLTLLSGAFATRQAVTARTRAAAHRRLAEPWDAAHAELTALAPVTDDLHRVREASLAPSVPVQAAADVWTALEGLEAALLDGSMSPEEAGPELEALARSLERAGSAEALDETSTALADVARAARRAREAVEARRS